MNWKNQNRLNYSNALYIPPSKYGTYVIADHINNSFKILTKNPSKIFNKVSSNLKAIKMKDYLNYNEDITSTNLNTVSKVNRFTRDDLRIQKPKITNCEPFTRYDSKKINTFNRFIYLPAPKTTPDIFVKHNTPVSKRNFNRFSTGSNDSSNLLNTSKFKLNLFNYTLN